MHSPRGLSNNPIINHDLEVKSRRQTYESDVALRNNNDHASSKPHDFKHTAAKFNNRSKKSV